MARTASRMAAALLAASLAGSGCAAAGLLLTAGTTGGIIFWRMKSGGRMSESALKRETARALKVLPDSVAVYDIRRGATSVSWMATAPSGVYRCDADDMLERASCVKQESGTGASGS